MANITEIEATNVVIAFHTFVTERDRGKHILVECDNQPTVFALTHCRAHNKILCECTRPVWTVQALFDLKLTFVHLPGKDAQIADALSCAHMSNTHSALAPHLAQINKLAMKDPCTYVLSFLAPPTLSRSRVQLSCHESRGQTADRACWRR